MITLYSTPTCYYCKKYEEAFKKNNIEYKKVDVASDPKLAEEMIQKSGQISVPVLDVNGEIVVGWNPRTLESIVKSNGKAVK